MVASGPARSGSALLLSVLSVVIVTAMAAGFMHLALSVTRRLSSSADTVKALNLAEAGLAEAYTGLAVSRTGNVGSEDAPVFFGGGMFWVEAEEHEGGLVELKSTALHGTGRATLGLACEPVTASVSSLGVFALSDVALAQDGLLDSYDSSRGAYAEQVGTETNGLAVLGSNASVSVEPGAALLGDILHGPVGGARVGQDAVVTGDASARPELAELPPIEVPEVAKQPFNVRLDGVPIVIPPGTSGYESIDVPANGGLVLQGPLTLVVDSLSVARGASISFDTTNGPIELYVEQDLDLSSGASVQTTAGVPSDLLVMISAPEGSLANLSASGAFHGFVYAPEAAVQVASGFEVFGGVVCHELRMALGCRLHFDVALSASLEALLPLVHAWRVVELPQQTATVRRDPFKLMGLDPNALLTPSEAHADQVLVVKYIATDGSTQFYSGLESDFDWSQVERLLYGERDGEPFYLPREELVPAPGTLAALLDLVSSTLSSQELRDALLAEGSLPEAVLVAALERTPAMTESDLRAVLDANQPLGDNALTAAVDTTALSSTSLVGLLIDSSPLSVPVLNAALARNPPLSISEVTNLLTAQ